MEINKICHPEKSAEKMVIDDSLRNESCNSYCPDFSDIYDDSFEFWDFLQSKRDRNEILNRDEERLQKNNFWDFLGPSSIKDQNDLLPNSSKTVDSTITTPNDSGIYLENESPLYPQIKNNVKKTVSNGITLQSPELKQTSSDDEFWDFLSYNSPVVTVKELLKDFNSSKDDKESGVSLFSSRCDESPFPSISECMESGRSGILNSSPSSVSVSKHNHGNGNEEREFNSRRSFHDEKNCGKLKQTVESSDHTNYIDVLKYLQQECVVSDKEVVSSIPSEKTFLDENSSRTNTKESGKYQRNLNVIYDGLDKFNEKHGKMQERSRASSNKSQLNVSSLNQKLVCDVTAPIISSKSNSDELKKDGNSNGSNSFKLCNQQTGGVRRIINKKPTKRFKRNIPNHLVSSYFNTIGNSKLASTISSLNAISDVNFNQPNMQTSLQNLNSTNSYHVGNGIKNNSTSKVKSFGINPIITNCTAPAITVNNTIASNSTTNTAPLYLLMSSNAETLQNPNYSHFFLVINNNSNGNSQMNQPTFVQNSQVINTNNLKSTPTQFGQVLEKVNSEISNKSDSIAKQKVLIVNQSNKAESSSSTSVTNSSVSNIKYQTIPQVYLPYTTLVNSTDGANQVRVQYLNKVPAVNNAINIPVTVNNLVTTSTVPTAVSNTSISSIPNLNFYSTVKSFGVKEQTTNLKLNPKPKVTQPKCRQPSLKPIKNIPLGKDKYAIQQISTPVPICDNEELNSSLGYYSNVCKINANNFLQKSHFDNKSGARINNNTSEALENNVLNFRCTLSTVSNKNFIQKNETLPNTNFTSTSVTAPSIGLVNKNTNLPEKCRISATNSDNVNAVHVPKPLQINKNISSLNTIQTINKDKQNASNFILNTTNSLVPMNGNSQNKSLATLKELFPPPISMVPVCVLPQTQSQDINQAGPSKVLILKGNGKEQTVTHKLKIDPIPYRERSISKKAKEKLKKGRLKTVRELLQERRKSSSGPSRNKMSKEIRVLRPVLRLSTCDAHPSKVSPIITNISKLNTDGNNTAATTTRKRPNILLLPSSKTIKKSNFTEDKQEQESEQFTESSVSENMEDSLSSYTSSALDKRNNRPRHYDMSQLNIGDFRVDDDIDSCGRFRSKYKVIFSKRQFYYDFPVSRCNQYGLKSTDAWEQMARIAVPFKTVVSMSLNERTIEISINAPPTIALGRLQSRTGVIPNSTIYDTVIESDCTWGCMIRNSFHHKIILRKKQASKVKSFLCHFDDRFLNIINVSSVCESGINHVDELSIFDGERSPTTLKQNIMKNKRHYIRRLSQWDSSENEDQKTVDEEDLVLLNQMCSCRVSCRSIRCSCVKAAKSCNSVCDCINCDNPLNILETLGMNLDFSLSDSCLFQNIYQIPKLVPFLTKEVKLTCCNTFARVQDCIPGTVLCPNVDCNVPLEFSWCKKIVCYPERNPRNHCSFCGQCCFSNGRHCLTCNRCYVATSKFPNCPTCQENTSVATAKDMESNSYNYDARDHDDHQKSFTKSVQKPEIIILDVYSLPKTSSNTENEEEPSKYKDSTNCDDPNSFKDCNNCQDSTDSVITID